MGCQLGLTPQILHVATLQGSQARPYPRNSRPEDRGSNEVDARAHREASEGARSQEGRAAEGPRHQACRKTGKATRARREQGEGEGQRQEHVQERRQGKEEVERSVRSLQLLFLV